MWASCQISPLRCKEIYSGGPVTDMTVALRTRIRAETVTLPHRREAPFELKRSGEIKRYMWLKRFSADTWLYLPLHLSGSGLIRSPYPSQTTEPAINQASRGNQRQCVCMFECEGVCVCVCACVFRIEGESV